MKKKEILIKLAFTITIIFSAIFSYYFYNNLTKASMDVLVNVFSILAGFLIGVVSLIGDPSLILSGSWRVAVLSRKNINKKLKRLSFLLYCYLIALVSIFLLKLFDTPTTLIVLKDSSFGEFLLENTKLIVKIFKIFILFISTIAFIFSFTLPRKLTEIQRKRVDQEIKRRRREGGIQD